VRKKKTAALAAKPTR